MVKATLNETPPRASSESVSATPKFRVARTDPLIERRVYKMRELRGLDKVAVRLIPTHENPADILTKPVDAKTFHAHRHTLMNLAADTGA
jgi:hypothetical protein